MPVVPPAAQSEKAQMDAADAPPPATQDGAPSGTSPERAVIPADAKPEKDAPPEKDTVKPLSELAKAHPDVHPHTDDGDEDDLDSNDAVSGQSPVDAKPAPVADGAEKAPAKDGVEKPPAADGVENAPAKDGAENPPAAGGVAKPPAADGVEKAPAADGAGNAAAADGASDPPAASGAANPPAAGAEPAPKEDAKEADKFNDQGLEEPTAPPSGVTRGPDPPSKADPKPPSKADPKPPSKAKPQPDAPPPTTQEIQDALDRIYANANKDDADRQRLANGHDTELQIPYRALGIVVLVFVAFFLGVRWKRRPRYGGYSQVSVVEVREEQLPTVVKPRHYRD